MFPPKWMTAACSAQRFPLISKLNLTWALPRSVQARATGQVHPANAAAATVRGVLLDIDGVLWDGTKSQAVAGAPATVDYLRTAGVPYKFMTNTTTVPKAVIAARLSGAGISCKPDDIISPAGCAAQYIQQHGIGPVALFAAQDLLKDFQGCRLLPDDVASGAAAVVIGDMGGAWSYTTLNRAFRLLMQEPKPLLLSLGKSRYFKAPDGLSLDVGPFTAALEFATGVEALVLGKPAAAVFELAAQALGLTPQQLVMVGDDVIGDVGGAQLAGCRGVLVQTGKYRLGDESGSVAPDAVLPSVAAFSHWFLHRA